MLLPILNWIVNGGAASFNKANDFDSLLSDRHGSQYKHSMLSQHYSIAELNELLENPYLPKRSSDLIRSYFDGSLSEISKQERDAGRGKKVKRTQQGIVYLLKSGEYYKIGKTKNLPSRLDSLAVGVRVPFDIQLIHNFKSNDYNNAEIELHKKFESKRADGEWFTLSPEDIEFVCSLQDGML